MIAIAGDNALQAQIDALGTGAEANLKKILGDGIVEGSGVALSEFIGKTGVPQSIEFGKAGTTGNNNRVFQMFKLSDNRIVSIEEDSNKNLVFVTTNGAGARSNAFKILTEHTTSRY